MIFNVPSNPKRCVISVGTKTGCFSLFSLGLPHSRVPKPGCHPSSALASLSSVSARYF